MQNNKTGIVLNIDGVLTNISTYLGSEYLGRDRDEGSDIGLADIDQTSLRLLKVLCDQVQAEVIIYSAWAVLKNTPEAWKTFFGHLVRDVPVAEVVSAADYLDSNRRPAALAAVAAKYARILLISDDIDETEAAYPHVRTTMRNGFQLEQLMNAATILGATKLAGEIQERLDRIPASLGISAVEGSNIRLRSPRTCAGTLLLRCA